VRRLLSRSRWVVVDKPSGLSVHKGWDASPDTVIRRLRGDLGRWVYPVHRLDRATSGALIVALDPELASALAASFRDGLVEKEYVALVRGTIDAPGTVDHPLAPPEGGERAEATTDYAPIAIARDRYTLVRLWPRTGRSHQLRRHMKHLSRPLLGDTTYGDGRENRAMREQIGLHRLALHAAWVALPDPDAEGGARVEVRSALPADLREPLERLGFTKEQLDAVDAAAGFSARRSATDPGTT
jgi:tRNA pseudouridine65 synthase